jgi:hypothetical protein
VHMRVDDEVLLAIALVQSASFSDLVVALKRLYPPQRHNMPRAITNYLCLPARRRAVAPAPRGGFVND